MLRLSVRSGFAAAALIASSPIVMAETLDEIIEQYEAFNQAGDPDEAARAKDEEPRTWNNVSPDYLAGRAAEAADMLERLETLEPSEGPETAILSHLLRGHIQANEYDLARVPFTGDWGFFAAPGYTALRTRLTTRAEAEAWIARLEALPGYFDDQTANMRRGIATGWTQHKDPLATSIAQIRAQTEVSPEKSTLYVPFDSLDAGDLSEEGKAELRAAGLVAVETAIEAYSQLLRFMENEYAPAARSGPGLATLEGGREVYAIQVAFHTAGAGYTPEEIHLLGQTEVARIRAEMEEIIAEVEFEGSFEDFISFLRTDPQFYAQSPEELLEKA